MMSSDPRQPTSFALPPERHRPKWERIISAFMAEDLDLLRSVQRGGARGRILAMLMRRCFDALGIGYVGEPVFDHLPPSAWYVEFAARHGLKLVVDGRYNPDFLFEDGSWTEVTLSEKVAYRKLFRYGHQAPRLLVVWLDAADGLHKRLCERIALPNAIVRPVDWYYPQLEKTPNGSDVIEKLEFLRGLKHDIL